MILEYVNKKYIIWKSVFKRRNLKFKLNFNIYIYLIMNTESNQFKVEYIIDKFQDCLTDE